MLLKQDTIALWKWAWEAGVLASFCLVIEKNESQTDRITFLSLHTLVDGQVKIWTQSILASKFIFETLCCFLLGGLRTANDVSIQAVSHVVSVVGNINFSFDFGGIIVTELVIWFSNRCTYHLGTVVCLSFFLSVSSFLFSLDEQSAAGSSSLSLKCHC